MKKYAMSKKGAKTLSKAIFSRTLLNFSKLFPPIVAYLFLYQYLGAANGIQTFSSLTLTQYGVLIAVMLLVMFVVARWDYGRLYNNVYMESANIRVEVVNRLKQLPLSYFGKRDLTDIAMTMMNDIALCEQIFSHAVPHRYATMISTVIISIMILLYNWQLALATLWVNPVSLTISSLAKKKQQRSLVTWVNSSRETFDVLQENIEQIQEIKSYNLEAKALKQFYEKLEKTKKDKVNIELVSGITNGFANIMLKRGLVTVAVVGAQMLLAGQINVLVYISFLMLSVNIYLPIESIISFMVMILMLDAVVARIKEIKTMPIQTGKTEMRVNNYDIVFDDVHFGYEDYAVINGVSFTAKQGEVTALIGESGSGKSTLAKLALVFGILIPKKFY